MEIHIIKKEFLAAVLIGLVVAISGCTIWPTPTPQQAVTAGTQGLKITYFGPDVEYPVPGQEIYLEAKVENIGDMKATNVNGELYLTTWDSTIEDNCDELRPPNPELGKEGETCTIKWKVTTPKQIERTETYDIGAHITYKYTTKTTATVYAFSESEYIKMMEAGEEIPKLKNIKNSNGPVHVDVRVQNVLKTGSTASITLDFNNVGGGNVEYDGDKHYYVINKATVKINDVEKASCENIHLKGGDQGSCTVNIDIPSGDQLKLPIEILTEYTYEISADTKVAVHPLLE
jgi:hypothetical protein